MDYLWFDIAKWFLFVAGATLIIWLVLTLLKMFIKVILGSVYLLSRLWKLLRSIFLSVLAVFTAVFAFIYLILRGLAKRLRSLKRPSYKSFVYFIG